MAKAVVILSSTVFIEALDEMILSDKVLSMISRMAATINSTSSLAHVVSGEWGDLASYGKEVLEVVQDACLQAMLEKQKF